jgi:hypothetical protein
VCARGDGIRGSKDLRAEIGKFPNLTNERKQMSNKTIKQRIALVAVSAMGFGLLSIAPAHAGAVAAGNVDFTAAALQPGVCFVSNTNVAGTSTATVVTGANFKVEVVNGVDTIYLSATNATVASVSGSFDTVTTTTATDAGTAATATATFKAGSVGTATISVAPTASGTVVDTLYVTVVAACGNDAYSASKSFAAAVTQSESKDNAQLATNVDSTDMRTVINGEAGYLAIALNDANGTDLSTTGALVATVTGDAYVDLQAEPNGSNPTVANKSNTDVLAATGNGHIVSVYQSVTNKPTTATVTVTFNGTVVATRTFTLQGVAASIDVKDVSVGKVNSVGVFRVKVKDAAGNELGGKVVDNDSIANSVAAISAITSGVTSSATTISDGDWSTETDGQFGCTTSGVTTLNVSHVVDSALTIKKSFTIACGGALDTWTISMDKASYQPGEIATLTLSGKDSKGAAVNTTDTISTVEYSFGGLTFVTAPTSADKFSSGAGVKTYKLSVGTTEGAFVGTFKIAGATDTAAKTVQYKVANSSATVSNADVLKSIVALIASINKQIQALQKLILKR